jgi:hypothetical protein
MSQEAVAAGPIAVGILSATGVSNVPGVPAVVGYPSVVGVPAIVGVPAVAGVPTLVNIPSVNVVSTDLHPCCWQPQMRIQRKTWCMGAYARDDYSLTKCPIQSRPYSMPESDVSPGQGLWIRSLMFQLSLYWCQPFCLCTLVLSVVNLPVVPAMASLLFISLLLLMFPPVWASLLLLASLAVPVISCAAVRLAVDVFLPLLFRPWSPSYAAFPTGVSKFVSEI